MARSRGGCLNCKARKRKCDQGRPECQACAQRGMKCQGYSTPLRWVNGVASRGRFAGASIPDTSLVSNLSLDTSNSNSNSDLSLDSENSAHSLALTPTPSHAASTSSTGSSAAISPRSVPDPQDAIFQRFMNSGLNRLYSIEASSWIKSFFEDMAHQSPALVMVAGAIQGCFDDGHQGMSVKSMEYIDLALQTFRQELAARYEVMHFATICAGLLVCLLCLLQNQPWTMYLELMVDVYDLKNKLNTTGQIPLDNPYTQHALEILGLMDLPSVVIGRITLPIGVWKLHRRLLDDCPDGRADGIEIVSGLPRSLLDIFAGMVDNDPEYTEGRFWAWPGQIGESLQCHYWECWRLSGILEVRRRQRMDKKAEGIQGQDGDIAKATPETEVILCRLISSIDALLKAYEEPRNQHLLVHKGLPYPVINAGLEVPLLKSHPTWKRTLDEVKSAFLEKDSLDIIGITFQLLDEAWENGTSTFDIDGAARSRKVELGLF
ncbi:hypothetical protein V3481_015319 [Fusarium oxysporum f. sp. vasinfectum]|uniref:Zn(2)-C6 fungal-type domain-containing protein n=1 Tax=Fusarium oxysporum f. sp. vasinfectum 25433 TaxID=1089449 RepID=X0KLC2_FUSOX|nr:hypothetical protein FOTG_17199 [Fusarium oxysporum f. sp. vasinfectum 25433]